MLAESPPDRTGRRRSVPGNSSDKTTPPSMEATSAATTPFRVTVSTVSRPFTRRVAPNRLILLLSSQPFLADESPDGLVPTWNSFPSNVKVGDFDVCHLHITRLYISGFPTHPTSAPSSQPCLIFSYCATISAHFLLVLRSETQAGRRSF